MPVGARRRRTATRRQAQWRRREASGQGTFELASRHGVRRPVVRAVRRRRMSEGLPLAVAGAALPPADPAFAAWAPSRVMSAVAAESTAGWWAGGGWW